LHKLGFELISEFYSTPEQLSIPYKNDLDPWRRRKENDDEEDRNSEKSVLPVEESQSCVERLEDGLYTGETILHIAIVQEEEIVVQDLLNKGISISSRAKGVFFQPRFQQPRSIDLTFLQKIKARLIGIDLNVEKFAAVKKLENSHSGCYYGEYPFSFAASVGNVDICDILYCCWQSRINGVHTCKMTAFEKLEIEKGIKESEMIIHAEVKQPPSIFKSKSFANLNSHKKFDIKASTSDAGKKSLMWRFVNAADSFGNTAMHMAVIHNQKQVIDWLMKIDEGRDSMELLNHEGFTPLTLAARYGQVEVFHHILYQHMSETAWTYGKVCFCARHAFALLQLVSLIL
jgi:hypothetical protein